MFSCQKELVPNFRTFFNINYFHDANCLDGTRPCFDHTHGITVACEPRISEIVSFSLTTAGLFLVLLWCIFHIIRWIRRRVALHLNCAHAIHQTSNCDPWSLFTSQQRHCMSDGAPNTPKSVTETFHVFPNQTKLKAIICVLPQGGHFTGNN